MPSARRLTQHGFHDRQGAVVGLRGDAQQMAEERVDIDAFKGLGQQPLPEGWPHSTENGFHVHVVVVKAVFTFVELDFESLKGREREDVGAQILQPRRPAAAPVPPARLHMALVLCPAALTSV